MRIFILSFLLSYHLFSSSIFEKYPSYSYVLSEFDIDSSYIFDYDFQQFITKNEKSLKRFYKNSLRRGSHYLPTFKYLLIDEGLSDLFIYLSMIESGLKSSALSPKKAAGLWQFMPSTARHYSLTINRYVDERYDPISSTQAAINYLQKLHKDFGKWYLAVMAYNCGEGRVAKAIKLARSDELAVLIDAERRYLPKETRAYIKKILLLAMIGENITLGFEAFTPIKSQYQDIVELTLPQESNLTLLAQKLEMPQQELLAINRHITKQTLLKKESNIIIPRDRLPHYYLRYETAITQKQAPRDHLISYVAESNISIDQLAQKYQSSLKEIFVANNFSQLTLDKGEMVLIPVTKEIFYQFSE
ncbi:MAG: lytic transglycosylase domain-containing protein [Campylobacterota bacterium]|nr:lytic transglycosylase domain-containing protein [Campylobacterota bacterium]